MKEQWKQQMRQKMADYKEPAPEVSWDEIDKAVASHKQKAKTVPMWPRRIAAAVLVLVTAGAGYYLLNREQPEIIEETAETRLMEGTIKHEPIIPHQQETPDLPILAQAKRHVQQVIEEKKAEALSVLPTTEESETIVVQEPEDQEQEAPKNPEPQSSETHAQPKSSSFPETPPTLYPSDLRRSASSNTRLMAKVYLSNALSGNSTNSFNDKIYKYSPLGFEMNEYTHEEAFTYSSAMSLDEEVHYRQPIRFGLLLRYALNERWSIESGLTYTLQKSDISFLSEDILADYEQQLSYVGIPVNVSYQLWSNRHFNVYAIVGGMVEKMVKGKRHMVTTKPMRKEEDKSVSIRPLQFSVIGGLGAEFQFIDWLSLYAEPGVGYYFDNGSSVPTFYQDRPLSFNLNIGLRFNIK